MIGTHTCSPAPIAGVERGRLGEHRLIEHQDEGALPYSQATLEPPFACRRVAGRRATSGPLPPQPQAGHGQAHTLLGEAQVMLRLQVGAQQWGGPYR
jgi:hypothetical protein